MVDLNLEARYEAILQLADGVGFTISEGNIIKMDKGEKPTEEEIQSKMDALAYARNRQAEYPTIAELTVALYDTDDRAAIDAKRASVKAKYPKP